jgi:dihydrolipoamide dehydrogenase
VTDVDNFDLIVIGGGPGGYPAAIKAAEAGKTVALIEKKDLGGTCLNRGCIPTKTLLHTTELYREIREAGRFGISCEEPKLDEPTMWQHKDKTLDTLRSGVAQLLKKAGVAVFNGVGRLEEVEGELKTVSVTAPDGQETALHGQYVLIAAGSKPARLPIPGADLPGVLNSDNVLDDNFLGGQQMVIIGGGVIGMEMATVYSNLGRKVTVLEAMDRVLAGMDKEISQNLKMILKKRGVDIITSAMVRGIEQDGSGFSCSYDVTNKKGEVTPGSVYGDNVLISTGRQPDTEGMYADSAMLDLLREKNALDRRGYFVVNDSFETVFPNVYAIGDVIGKIQLAHVATAQGIAAVEQMFGWAKTQNLDVVPSCVYTDPEIASVGMTEEQAKEAGIEAESRKYLMSANGKSVLTLQERGFIKLVAAKADGRILGAHLMCARATDIIGQLGLAIVKGMTVQDVASVIMAHPTFSEGIMEAAQSF